MALPLPNICSGLNGPSISKPSIIVILAIIFFAHTQFRETHAADQPTGSLSQRLEGIFSDGDISAALTPSGGTVPKCEPPQIDMLPLRGGRAEVRVKSECRKYETVQFIYANFAFFRKLNEFGETTFNLDCFAGDGVPLGIVFADGSRENMPIVARDLDRISKVAVIWSAPVNLDLHAFEYSAMPQSPDHVWEGATGTSENALGKISASGRGHGFLSSSSDGTEEGTKIEVYTFFHHRRQTRGVINMALDYESRARDKRSTDTCGTGLYSEVEYEAILLEPDKSAKRLHSRFSPLSCGKRLSGIDRLNHKAVPEIVIRN